MTLNTPIAILAAAALVAGTIYCSAPRYQIFAIQNATNPAVWRVNTRTGDVNLCATAANEKSESGCSATFKQF